MYLRVLLQVVFLSYRTFLCCTYLIVDELFQCYFFLQFLLFISENMRSELLRVQQEEMQRLHRDFEVQLASVKLQLQRTNELHSRNVSIV